MLSQVKQERISTGEECQEIQMLQEGQSKMRFDIMKPLVTLIETSF